MPSLVEGTEVGGHLRAELADELGLTAGIPVAGGGRRQRGFGNGAWCGTGWCRICISGHFGRVVCGQRVLCAEC